MSFIRFGNFNHWDIDSDDDSNCDETVFKVVKSKSNDESDAECSNGKRFKNITDEESDEEESSDEESDEEESSDEDLVINWRISSRFKLYHDDDARTDSIKVKHALPSWILRPTIIPRKVSEINEIMPEFSKKLAENLVENSIVKFLPVQKKIIPWIFNHFNTCNSLNCVPQDAWISCPPGSGKTLSYVLPIIQILLRMNEPVIRCLAIVPDQYLASHIAGIFNNFTKGTHLKVANIHEGTSSFKGEQKMLIKEVKGEPFCRRYEALADILVITPAKLIDHLQKTKGFDLGHLKFLIVNQADIMMDIKHEWMTHIQGHLNKFLKKTIIFQKLFFSTTLITHPMKLEKLKLCHPILFAAEKSKRDKFCKMVLPHELEEFYMITEPALKPAAIAELITGNKWFRVLCFCNTPEQVIRLDRFITCLCPEVRVRELSFMHDRNIYAGQFSIGDIDVLICTDYMVQGLEIPNVSHVISYDGPKYFKDYMERAERTGKPGRNGTVLTLLSKHQVSTFISCLRSHNRYNIGELELHEEAFRRKVKYMNDRMKLMFPLEDYNDEEKLENGKTGEISDKGEK